MRGRIIWLLFFFVLGVGLAYAFASSGVKFFGVAPKDVVSAGQTLLTGNESAIETPYGRIMLSAKRLPAGGRSVSLSCLPCKISNPLLAETAFVSEDAVLKGIYKNSKFSGELNLSRVSLPLKIYWQSGQGKLEFKLDNLSIKDLFYELRSIVPEAQKGLITGSIAGQGVVSWPDIQMSFVPEVRDFSVEGLVSKQHYRQGSFSYTVRNALGEDIQRVSGEGTPDWVPLSSMARYLPAAVVAAEDAGFWSHPGYDLSSMIEAMEDNRRSGRIRRGGSTITQQLAKNLFLTPERNYARKLRELLYAAELDRKLGKKRILEIYINIVEWGLGVYGIKRASEEYFGKSPEDLTLLESAWLSSIIPAPRKAWKRQLKRERLSLQLAFVVLGRMEKRGDISSAEASRARADKLKFVN
jgi:hypothetical protein